MIIDLRQAWSHLTDITGRADNELLAWWNVQKLLSKESRSKLWV
nr:hypothetical protein [Mycoplasmopsis bovis]